MWNARVHIVQKAIEPAALLPPILRFAPKKGPGLHRRASSLLRFAVVVAAMHTQDDVKSRHTAAKLARSPTLRGEGEVKEYSISPAAFVKVLQ
jgi:hypothetical protein